MVTIQRNNLEAFLGNLRASSMVNLTSNTKVDMKLTGNPLRGKSVTKRSVCTYQFGYSYANAVNRRLKKYGISNPVLGSFTGEGLPWGEWKEGYVNKLIEHKEKVYGRFYCLSNQKAKTSYFIDGVPATPEEILIIKTFEKPRNNFSNTQAQYGLTSNQVKPLSFCLDSIESMKVNGNEYVVV